MTSTQESPRCWERTHSSLGRSTPCNFWRQSTTSSARRTPTWRSARRTATDVSEARTRRQCHLRELSRIQSTRRELRQSPGTERGLDLYLGYPPSLLSRLERTSGISYRADPQESRCRSLQRRRKRFF